VEAKERELKVFLPRQAGSKRGKGLASYDVSITLYEELFHVIF
jgi:hypothetical protein